ncbi:hypothetical protein Tco_1315713, partial [Tanacetum coccineum]
MLLVPGETMQVDRQELLNATTIKMNPIIIPNNAAFQTKDLDTYDSNCDDISNAKAVLMANISNYGSDVISEAQQDSMILFVIEQMSEQMINHVNNWEKANKEQNNESVIAELEIYKERAKTFEQRLNTDLSSREKMIDSQMDDMIKEKLALKEQVDSLKQNLSKQIKEKELHMLTKPQAFYDNIHKQALGYQNPFYLKKAQQIKQTLYDGIVISAKHVAMPMIDDEETLILEEESRSKMLSDDFRKHFTPQQELSAESAFWLRMSNPTNKPFDASSVKIKAPKELSKVRLVNESLKKLKFHLAMFDNVVKIRTTPDARTEVFDQMDAVVQQSSVDKQCLKIAKKELLLENDRILQQIMSQDVLLTVMNSMSLIGESVNM